MSSRCGGDLEPPPSSVHLLPNCVLLNMYVVSPAQLAGAIGLSDHGVPAALDVKTADEIASADDLFSVSRQSFVSDPHGAHSSRLHSWSSLICP